MRFLRVKAHGYLSRMFEALVSDPGLLAPADRLRAERDGAERAVCDTIAGMTDREALIEYRRLFEPEGDFPLPA